MDDQNKNPFTPGGDSQGDNGNGKRPKNSWMIYAVIICVLLLFSLLMNNYTGGGSSSAKDVQYSEFLSMLAEGKIETADVETYVINFTTLEGEEGEERAVHYRTGRVPDSGLVERLNEAGVKFGTEIHEETSLLVTILLSYVLPLGLMVGLSILLFRTVGKQMGGGMSRSAAKKHVPDKTGVTFADVAGEDEAKASLAEIVDYLHNPEKYRDIGAKMPKGALLVGPPGTGKTLLAKAVAGEANVPFFSISGSEFVELFVGMGAARVRDLFDQAKKNAPCIVFIDEIDAGGKTRDRSLNTNDEREQTLNQLLTEMDGFEAGKGVVILAATNRPDSLDKALLRPGRFDRQIHVELPDLAGREAILKVHAKGVRMDPGVNWREVALATSGTSGADLANIINEGALLAVKEGHKEVTQADLEESIETVVAGYQRKGAVISPREKKLISYHEIGHALVAAKLRASSPVHKITIIPRTNGALGYTMQVDEDERHLSTREELEGRLCTLTAGRAAEELIFGEVTSGAANDIEQATRLARLMVTRLGMSEEFGMTTLAAINSPFLAPEDAAFSCSERTAARVDSEVIRLIEEAHRKARGILEENQDKLHELAAYLLDKETITGEEFMRILNAPALNAPEA